MPTCSSAPSAWAATQPVGPRSPPELNGIGLVASYQGRALDDLVFERIFECARSHQVPVLVHPRLVSPAWGEVLRLDNPVLAAGFGFLMDNALTILRMACSESPPSLTACLTP